MKNIEFEYLVDALKSLPSIGSKVAERIAFFLINQDEQYVTEFIKRVSDAKHKITFCEQCNNFTNGTKLCEICSNQDRNTNKLCVVKSIDDLAKIESTNVFDGIYYVLNDEINVRKDEKIDSKIIRKLMQIIKMKNIDEVILATNFTINGEATALFISKIIKELSDKINVYRLAIGLPINSALDYADHYTLKKSIINKTKYE